jgi:hypothetical protein
VSPERYYGQNEMRPPWMTIRRWMMFSAVVAVTLAVPVWALRLGASYWPWLLSLLGWIFYLGSTLWRRRREPLVPHGDEKPTVNVGEGRFSAVPVASSAETCTSCGTDGV